VPAMVVVHILIFAYLLRSLPRLLRSPKSLASDEPDAKESLLFCGLSPRRRPGVLDYSSRDLEVPLVHTAITVTSSRNSSACSRAVSAECPRHHPRASGSPLSRRHPSGPLLFHRLSRGLLLDVARPDVLRDHWRCRVGDGPDAHVIPPRPQRVRASRMGASRASFTCPE